MSFVIGCRRKSTPSPSGRTTSLPGLLLLAALAAAGFSTGDAEAQTAQPLRYMFALPEPANAAPLPKTRFTCGPLVRPMTDMGHFFSFYKPSSTQSVVDATAMKAFSQRAWPTAAVTAKLLTAVDAAVATRHDRQNAANCIVQQIRAWADKDALLGNLDDNDPLGRRQAVMIGGWTAVGLANAYAVALQTNPRPGEADVVVRGWFARLAETLTAEFAPPSAPRPRQYRWLDENSNVRYWAAASVGLLAVHLQDREKFEWAMGILRDALDHVPEDGGLPRELARGGRALYYQVFAMQPIAFLVALADANQVALGPEREGKLDVLAQFTARAFANPDIIRARTGYPQMQTKPDMVSWVDIVLPHVRARNAGLAQELEKVARPLRPLTDSFVALPTTALFLK